MPISLSLLCTQLTKQALTMYPGKEDATSKSNFLKNSIISDTLMSHDIRYQKKSYREIGIDTKEKFYIQESQKQKYNFLRTHITNVCQNNNHKIFDSTLSTDIKTQILIHSIDNAIKRFETIASSKSYMEQYFSPERSKGTSLKDKHHEIIHYLKDKILIAEKCEIILDLLELTNTNFILKDDKGESLYPVISDLIFDTFNLDFYFEKDSEFIAGMCSKISYVKTYQHENILKLPNILYSKTIFIEAVKKYNIRPYILHEYTRTLNCDINLMRNLYLEILYYNTQGSNALKTKLDMTKLYPREFIMCLTKIIIPLEKPLLTIESLDILSRLELLDNNSSHLDSII